MNKKFWNWVKNEDDARTLYLEGVIAEETWFGDEVTPKKFKSELMNGNGDITIWINSPGGDVFAASQIYNMLMDYKGKVTVKIDGLAASAASVIAMAGGEVFMSPVSMFMIHNPMTLAFGDTFEMEKAISMLSEVKESIINAYELKTGLSRAKLSHLMDAESWFNANKAVELGFADRILFAGENEIQDETKGLVINSLATRPCNPGFIFSKTAVMNSFLSKLPKKEKQNGTDANTLYKRLDLLKK